MAWCRFAISEESVSESCLFFFSFFFAIAAAAAGVVWFGRQGGRRRSQSDYNHSGLKLMRFGFVSAGHYVAFLVSL